MHFKKSRDFNNFAHKVRKCTLYLIFSSLFKCKTSLIQDPWYGGDDDFQQSNISCLANTVRRATRSALIVGRANVSGITPKKAVDATG